MNPEVLNASLEMAKNYIRISKGRANRIGHNWEACVEWFMISSLWELNSEHKITGTMVGAARWIGEELLSI